MEFLTHPEKLIEAFGAFATIGIILIVFAESGLLIGFFLPGDALLVTAGVLAAKGGEPHLSLPVIIVGVVLAAITGDQVGYAFGRKVGPALFRRPNSRFFKQEHVEKTRLFFADHGPKAIVLARFVPFIRTFTPIVAGVGRMHYPTFMVYNVFGGILWGAGLTTLGYVLGDAFNVDKYLLPIIGGVVLVSLLPVLREAVRARRAQ
ncbi:MAG: VTT domain-containing protein [Actinobacteria bacterium]|nr:VTT domain-containing protein [Actinomycetota bacterium]